MRSKGRSWLRRLTPTLAATLLGLSGVGLATATPAAADPNLNMALAVTTPVPGAAANSMYVGQQANYALTVTAGPNGLNGVTVTDKLPADVAYTGSSGSPWTCSATPDTAPAKTSTLACTLASLVANKASTATVNLTVSKTTTLSSVAFQPSATGNTAAATPVPAIGSTQASVPILPAADVSLTKTMNPRPAAGQVSYDLTVTNAGPSPAAAPIAIADTLPRGYGLLSSKATPAVWTCTAPAPPVLSCVNSTPLPAGATSKLTIVAAVSTGGRRGATAVPKNSGRVTSGASVSSPTFDLNRANNKAFAPQGAVPYGNLTDPGPCGAATAGVRHCNLLASPGTVTVPGFAAPIAIWGFVIDPGTGATPPGTVPGPTLIANEGETLQLAVRNALPTVPGDSNLLAVTIPGLTTSHPDSVGVASGSSTVAGSPSYTWANLKPGTYVYEAAQTTNGARQVAMGLSGLLVVRPTGFSPANLTLFDPPATPVAGNACTTAGGSSQFTTETLVQVNELSSDFHKAPFTSTMSPGGGNAATNSVFTLPDANHSPGAAGGSADRAFYAPDVFLINGQAYPNTDVNTVLGTDCVAVHYADLGMLEKSLGVLGRRQIVMADDSNALAHPQNLATKYLNPGEEVDAVVDMTGATAGAQFPIMDFGRHLHNGPGSALNTAAPGSNTGMTLGGQLALFQVPGTWTTTNPTVDQVGLDRTTVAVGPPSCSTAVPCPSVLNLTVNAIPSSGTIAGGEYTIDNILPAGTAPAAQSIAANGTAAIQTTTLSGLGNGDHIIWARVRDGAGWSDPPSGVVFTLDQVVGGANPNGGPTITNATLNPSITNGSTPNSLPGQIGRTDAATVTAGSSTVTDYQIGISPADVGQPVSGVGIPAGAVVGNVQPMLQFTILVNGVPTPATANGTTVNIGVPGVPAVSADMVIDGTATPGLPDWAITSFTWSIDGGTATMVPFPAFGTPGAPALGASVEIITAIPQATLGALAGDTSHTVTVTATEVQGTSTRTGNPITLTFTKTATGPTATIDSITPNPAGPAADFLGNANYFPSVRIRGTFNDIVAPVAGGEMWFLPVVGTTVVGLDSSGKPAPDGQGIQITPDSGMWTAPAGQPVPFLVDLPSTEFNGLPQGPVRIYVHGKDVAGQWNQTYATADVIVDKTPPQILGSTTTPVEPNPAVSNPTPGHYTLTFYAQDPATAPPACTLTGVQITPQGCGVPATSKVTAVEWIISDPNGVDIPGQNDFTVLLPTPSDGPGPFSVDVSGGPQTNGAYPAGDQVHYRIRDGAGNWGNWSLVSI